MPHVVVPVMPPFEPGKNKAHEEMMNDLMQDAEPVDEAYSFPTDDTFWPVFVEQVTLCPEAKVEPVAAVSYGHHYPVTANRQWIRAYLKAVDEIAPFLVTIQFSDKPVTFQASEKFWSYIEYMHGVSDGSEMLTVKAADRNTSSEFGQLQVAIDTWNRVITDWNDALLRRRAKKQGARRLGGVARPVDDALDETQQTRKSSRYGIQRTGSGSNQKYTKWDIYNNLGHGYGDTEMLGYSIDEYGYYYHVDDHPDGPIEKVERGCPCSHHAPRRTNPMSGKVMAAAYQSQRKLHFALTNQDAFTTETAVSELEALDEGDKVIDLLQTAFPHLARSALKCDRAMYLQAVLDDPMSRGRAGGRKALPETWPPTPDA
ncbi:hypothetical protein DIPPA_10342 [Diplonema papillatum]|nr:hypothetical protein DIPPA_10342 [Diplonema papillatum]